MAQIGLVEAIAQVRRELAQAVTAGVDAGIQFPVGAVTLEFQVGVTRSVEASGGVKVWVLELGAAGEYAKETVHTLTVELQSPVDAQGRPIKVAARSDQRPG